MRAYLGIKYHSDHSNKQRIDRISSIIEECGYSVTCIVRDIEKWGQVSFSPRELMIRTFEVIDSSDVLVIDLSEKGVGLGIEAGYAFSRNVPIIAIAHGNEISTTLIGISKNHYVYEYENDLLEFLKTVLR
jgi:hypothetical protein